MMNDDDRRRLLYLMRRMGVPRVRVDVRPESKRDIAVLLMETPVIMCGKKWLKAKPHERAKRLLHELLHVKGLRHDVKARSIGYHSNPEADSFTRALYRDITGVQL